MRTIPANRCGYDGYTCIKGTSFDLNALFTLGVPVCYPAPNDGGQIITTDPEGKLIEDLTTVYGIARSGSACFSRILSAYSTVAADMNAFFGMSCPISADDIYSCPDYWRVVFRPGFGGGLIPVWNKYFGSLYSMTPTSVSQAVNMILNDTSRPEVVSALAELTVDMRVHFGGGSCINAGSCSWLYIAFGKSFSSNIWEAVKRYVLPIGDPHFDEIKEKYLSSVRYTTLDNWYNLPISFPDPVTDLQVLLDMHIDADKIRDIASSICGTEEAQVNPAALFDYYNGRGTKIVDAPYHYGEKSINAATMGEWIGVFTPMVDRLLCDNCTGNVGEIYESKREAEERKPYPEILEPIVSPPMPQIPPIVNIQPPVLPDPQGPIDIIEDFIHHVYDPPSICPIENLIIEMVAESICSTLKIVLVEGTPFVESYGDTPPALGTCTYRVVNGVDPNLMEVTLYVNNEEITVPLSVDGSYDPIQAPFHLYLNIPQARKQDSYLSTVPNPDEETTAIYIGGVKEVTGGSSNHNSERCDEEEGAGIQPRYYAMYVVEQEECPVSITVPEMDLCGLENLLVAMNLESPCETLKIKLTRGNPMVKGKCKPEEDEGPLTLGECFYRVEGKNGGGMADVTVNGKDYKVVTSDMVDLKAPFDLYLIIPYGNAPLYLTLDPEDAKSKDVLVHIGGVREVDGTIENVGDADMCKDEPSNPERVCYKMYVIYEDECPVAEYVQNINLCGLESLVAEMANNTMCDSVEIEHTSGVSIVMWQEDKTDPKPEPEIGPNEYVVKAGTFNINNQDITVPDELLLNEFPCTVYLKVHRRGNEIEASYTTDGSEEDVIMELASIRVVRSTLENVPEESGCDDTDDPTIRHYKLLEVDIVNCPDYIAYNPIAVEDLIAELVDANICQDVKIERIINDEATDEQAIFYYEPPDPPPDTHVYYRINEFKAYYNEVEYVIPETQFVVYDEDRYWYLEIHKKKTGIYTDTPNVRPQRWETRTHMVVTEEPEDPDSAIFLGGVRVVVTDNYKAYVIDQSECAVVTDLARFPDMSGQIEYIEGKGIQLAVASPVEGLVSVMLQDSGCEVFGIRKTKGRSTAKKRSQLEKCTYSISHGSIKSNGVGISVGGISSVSVSPGNTKDNPKSIYLNVSVSQSSVKAELGTSKSGSYSVCVATIYSVSSTDMKNPPDWLKDVEDYSMYVVNQLDCQSDFDIIRLDEGFMFSNGTGSSPHPYKVYPYCEL